MITLSGYLVDLFSWQISWITLGGIVTLIGLPIAFVFLRNNPAEMGLQPDGDPRPLRGVGSGSSARRQGLFEVDQWYHSFRSPPIWNLSAAFTVCGITVGLLSFHFVPYASGELGIDAKLASIIFAILTGLNVFGAIGGGWLADRFGRKNVLGTVYSVRCIAFLVLIGGLLAVQQGISLPIIGSPGLASLWIFALLAGFSWIASVPITAGPDCRGIRTAGFGYHLGDFVRPATRLVLSSASSWGECCTTRLALTCCPSLLRQPPWCQPPSPLSQSTRRNIRCATSRFQQEQGRTSQKPGQ